MAMVLPEMELGIDQHIAREMRTVILDEQIEINVPQHPRNRADEWSEASLIEYGQWLCALLEITPNSQDKPLSVIQIERASKLGIGPSRRIVEKVLPEGGVPELQDKLGFRLRGDYADWTKSDLVKHGRKLAGQHHYRLGTSQIKAAHKRGTHMSLAMTLDRFGSLQNYQELIGYPSVRGWGEQDYLEWGAAFKRQNGLEVRITANALRVLSAQGKGPNYKATTKHFESMDAFNELAEWEYWRQLEIEQDARDFVEDQAKVFLETNPILQEHTKDLSAEDQITIVSKYRLITELAPGTSHTQRYRAARNKPDRLAAWIIREGQGVDMAMIEEQAASMRMDSLLWPTYRFQNVKLKLG